MPFHLTATQLRLFNSSHNEREMVRYVKLYRAENYNQILKRRFHNEALHYFMHLPRATKRRIEDLEHMNKRRAQY